MDSAEAGRDDRAAGAEEVERLRWVLDEEAQRHLRLRAVEYVPARYRSPSGGSSES